MSITDLGNGWVEYEFYYGNACWPSYETYRYHKANQQLKLRREIQLVDEMICDDREYITIHLTTDNKAKLADPANDAYIHIHSGYAALDGTRVPPMAFLMWWIDVPRDKTHTWELFQAERIQEEQS